MEVKLCHLVAGRYSGQVWQTTTLAGSVISVLFNLPPFIILGLVVVFMPKLLDNSLVTPMDSTADEENWSSSGNMIELFRSQGGLGGT